MNIGINTRLLLKDRMEGIAVFTWEICRRMAENHPETNFYFFFDRKPDVSFTSFKNINAIVIHPQARHPVLWQYWFEYALPKALKAYNIDVFFSPESYLSLKTTVPSVMVTHDLGFLHFPQGYKTSHLAYFNKYMRRFHEHAQHIVTVSEFSKADILNQYQIPDSNVTVAYNAVQTKFKQLSDSECKSIREKVSEGNPYVLYVGSIHPRKNIDGLIKGFENWKSTSNTNHKLILFGRWAFGNNPLQKLIHKSPVKQDILFKSDIDVEVEKIMAAADSFVYPSFHEGFGIPIIEAMSCGVPVVTSGHGAMKEIAGDAAIFIDPKDPLSISNGISSSIENEELREIIKAKSTENLTRFSWQTSSEIVYETIKLQHEIAQS